MRANRPTCTALTPRAASARWSARHWTAVGGALLCNVLGLGIGPTYAAPPEAVRAPQVQVPELPPDARPDSSPTRSVHPPGPSPVGLLPGHTGPTRPPSAERLLPGRSAAPPEPVPTTRPRSGAAQARVPQRADERAPHVARQHLPVTGRRGHRPPADQVTPAPAQALSPALLEPAEGSAAAVVVPIAAGLLLTAIAMYKRRGLPGGH